MNEKSQIVFMQARLIRLAAKKWNTDIQKANALMNQYGLLDLIEDCFDTFHTEGDNAVFYPVCRKTPCFSYGDIRHFHRIYASN